MDFVITADTHVDHNRWGDKRRNGATVDSSWLSAAACFSTAADLAVDTGAGLAVAGDVFMHGVPHPEAVEMVADILRPVVDAGLPVIVESGNHEQIRIPVGQRLALDRFREMGVHVVTEPDVVELDDGTQVACLPWLWRQQAIRDHDLAGMTGDDIDDVIAGLIVDQLDELADNVDSDRGPVMLLGHATLSTAAMSSGRRASELSLGRLLSEPVIELDDVLDGPWTTAFFGHVHYGQTFADGRVWIPGSPDRIDFGDEHHPKRVLRWEADTGTVTTHPTPAREMLTIRSDADLERLDSGTLVRVQLPEGEIDCPTEWRAAADSAGTRILQVRPAKPAKKTATPDTTDVQGPAAGLVELVDRWADKQDVNQATRTFLTDTVTRFETDMDAA